MDINGTVFESWYFVLLVFVTAPQKMFVSSVVTFFRDSKACSILHWLPAETRNFWGRSEAYQSFKINRESPR